ncbi:MAG: hypothetical protein IBX64_11060 [Actinobacteria bacterium]|nr:hypothetical protein [Actinomycetota bacterium]
MWVEDEGLAKGQEPLANVAQGFSLILERRQKIESRSQNPGARRKES